VVAATVHPGRLGPRPPYAFCAGVSWSVVMARAASADSNGAPTPAVQVRTYGEIVAEYLVHEEH
jgi:hypothetical protein